MNIKTLLNENLNLQAYFWLLFPITLGMGSSFFIPKNKIPRVRSKWSPPGWVFGIVWPILYLLLGYASYLVWKENKEKINDILQIYIIHVLLLSLWWINFASSPNGNFATFTLFLLVVNALYIGLKFHTINETAGQCFIPYILWLIFATFLTSQTIKYN